MNHRIEQIASSILAALPMIVLKHSHDQRLRRITFTHVVISKDLSHAKVYVQLPEQDAAQSMTCLVHAGSFLRKHLSQCLSVHRIPRLVFHEDHRLQETYRINELMIRFSESLPNPSSSHAD